jgi:D-alanine-D-alanine ligase
MNVSDFGKVAVLLGGPSAEREISLMSGNAVLEALRSRGIDAHAFDPLEHPLFELQIEGFKRVFIALHGRYGEDGTVQGALETMHIPYTGSGVIGSAITMDKQRTKLIWQAAGIPTPKFVMLTGRTNWQEAADYLGLPLIVKPAREGSSLGLTKVEKVSEFEGAYEKALFHDDEVIAEQFIKGQELTAGILGKTILPLIRIEAPGGNYDYQNKYFSDDTKYHCPSGIDPEKEAEIQVATLEAFNILDCRGWARADMILRDDGQFFFLEMNSSPGMTSHSLVPMAAKQMGIDFPELCVRILSEAQCE